MKNDKKCVILLSGGLDSSTLLYYYKNIYDCYPITFMYSQRHNKEIQSAASICRSISPKMKQKLITVPVNLGNILKSTLTGYGDIPEGSYDDESMSQTVVPGRNLILLAIATGYAQSIGAKYIAYAAHSGDHPIYPDCRPEFIKATNTATELGYSVTVQTPFSLFNKGDIVQLGTKLKVPYELTWTCYKGGLVHCGKCGACDERKKAFQSARVKDITVYED